VRVLGVTDHACIRYLERVVGLELSRVRRSLGGRAASDKDILRYMETLGACDIGSLRGRIAHLVVLAREHPGCCGVTVAGHRYVIVGQSVVTVERAHQPDKRKGRKRG